MSPSASLSHVVPLGFPPSVFMLGGFAHTVPDAAAVPPGRILPF
jgi:hypothetical protein